MKDIYVSENIPIVKNKYLDYYMVKNGDTLYKIAQENSLDAKMLAQLNGIDADDYIYPNQILLIPRAGSIIYFTTSGDTLKDIVKGFGVSLSELLSQNDNIYLQPEQLIIYNRK